MRPAVDKHGRRPPKKGPGTEAGFFHFVKHHILFREATYLCSVEQQVYCFVKQRISLRVAASSFVS